MITAGDNVISVPRSQVRPYIGQPREEFSYDRLRELAESMRERGQLNPVIVRSTGDAKIPYEIVDGERRWRAAELAGMSHLLVLVSSVGKGDAQYVQSVIANSAREDLSPIEQSRAVARVAAMPGFRDEPSNQAWLTKLAAVFGRSPAWINQMLKLDGVAPEVKTLVEQRKLPAVAAVQLADVKSPARQAEIGRRVASQPMRQTAATNAVKNAVRVEQVREGKTPKPQTAGGTAERSTAAADARLVAELVGKLADSAESLLDLPVARLRVAFKGKQSELKSVVARVSGAVDALDQLQQSLERLGDETV